MSDDAQQTTTGSGLSFERAEFEDQASSSLACAFCKQPISGHYWQVNQRTACAQCHTRLMAQLQGASSRAHFLRALQHGALAAGAGSAAWVVISKVTGYEIGIVAIGIGYLVGKAVRKGAGGFGGARYQVLAMALTYSAIALASLPAILEALRESPKHAAAAAAVPAGLGAVIAAWALLLGIALISPFLGGVEHFMGLIILAIGLYEAWKLTRAVPVQVLGPFAIETSAPAPLTLAPDPDATD